MVPAGARSWDPGRLAAGRCTRRPCDEVFGRAHVGSSGAAHAVLAAAAAATTAASWMTCARLALTLSAAPRAGRRLPDAVDVTRFNPESEANPSAVKALMNWQAKPGQIGQFKAGISDAGVRASCNPDGAGIGGCRWQRVRPLPMCSGLAAPRACHRDVRSVAAAAQPTQPHDTGHRIFTPQTRCPCTLT